MVSLANISFLSEAEKLTLMAYEGPREFSVVVSEVIGRLAAGILLSGSAALDLAFHTACIVPAFTYSAIKSLVQWEADFNLPWQHLQRIRNAVAPLLLGSAFGILHPLAGIAVCEPTDKHIALGMLTSNTNQLIETPCSPVHALSIIEDLALTHRYVEDGGVSREIFPPEYLEAIRGANEMEASLEILHAQEWIHRITNLTLAVMASIKMEIEFSGLTPIATEVLVRLSGFLIPVLTAIDVTIATLGQAFFLAAGAIRTISGRGPIYTEATSNPRMHASFFLQNLLKLVGNLAGTVVWFISPMTGFRVSLFPAHQFFKMQMHALMSHVRTQMDTAQENSRFVVPIVFGNGSGDDSPLSIPSRSMHTTYLIVEKKNDLFNLYWVNRPDISLKQGLDATSAFAQIQSMLGERFPFMDTEKLLNYPVQSKQPTLEGAVNFGKIADQGNCTNCVVSNLFGMLETLDSIRGEDPEISRLRNKVVRESLMHRYRFYQNDVSPFGTLSERYSLNPVCRKTAAHPEAAI